LSARPGEEAYDTRAIVRHLIHILDKHSGVKRPIISIGDTGSNREDRGMADEVLRRFDHIRGMERLEFVGKNAIGCLRLPVGALADQ